MQGDWWISSNFNSPRENPEQTTNHNQTAWGSSVSRSSPSVVTLAVHPLFAESTNPCPRTGYGTAVPSQAHAATGHQHHRHSICSQSNFGVASSASNLILAAQRRKRLYFNQQKAASFLHSDKKLGFGSQAEICEPDLTWTSFFEHRRTQGSSNSAYSSQDGGQDSCQAGPGPGQVSSGGLNQQMSSDDLKQFERKLEREREKRLHTEPPPPVRLESRVPPDSSSQCDQNMKRNGFRPTSKNTFMTRAEQNLSMAAFRHGHTPVPMDTLGSLAITNSGPAKGPGAAGGPGAPGTLRGQSIGFGSREGLATIGLSNSMGSSVNQGRPAHGKSRTRSMLLGGQSEKYRQNQYQFQDPVCGATPDFQQRLTELTSLESDTVRYERTKKAKKKAKQDSG